MGSGARSQPGTAPRHDLTELLTSAAPRARDRNPQLLPIPHAGCRAGRARRRRPATRPSRRRRRSARAGAPRATAIEFEVRHSPSSTTTSYKTVVGSLAEKRITLVGRAHRCPPRRRRRHGRTLHLHPPARTRISRGPISEGQVRSATCLAQSEKRCIHRGGSHPGSFSIVRGDVPSLASAQLGSRRVARLTGRAIRLSAALVWCLVGSFSVYDGYLFGHEFTAQSTPTKTHTGNRPFRLRCYVRVH